MDKSTLFDTLIVVKRSGQRTSFQGEKIAIAIKKAFDSVENNYIEEDVNKVYSAVLKVIEKDYALRKTIQIEDIQDLIEETLKKKNYMDVFLSFKNYRERRSASRKSFVTKQQHKFLKSVEALGMNSQEEMALKKETPNQRLSNYGKTIATGFTKSYLLDTKVVRAIDSGILYFPNLEALAIGSIESIELDVSRLFKEHIHLTKEEVKLSNVEDFFDQLLLLIKSLANSIHGQIQISNLDYDVTSFILSTYKECLKEEVSSFLEYSGFKSFLGTDRIEKEIDKFLQIDENITILSSLYPNGELLKIGFEKASFLAVQKTGIRLRNAYWKFLTYLNSIYDKTKTFPKVCIGLGTATSPEAQLFISTILELEKENHYLEPFYVFKLKKGKNSEAKDLNYSLRNLYLDLAITNPKFMFANLEMKENKRFYIEDDPSTEICYFSDGARAIEDTTIQEARISGGKGNLFTVSINLPRLALKTKQDEEGAKQFFERLDKTLDLAKDTLCSCFELISNKNSEDFPFLFGQNIWLDGKNMKENDRLRKLWKHGTLAIHFVGLDETCRILNEIEENDKMDTKIMEYIRKKIDTYRSLYNLNFTLSAKKLDEACQEFNKIDTAIFGKIKGITNQEMYHNGFEKNYTNWKEALSYEKQYHSITLGGHLTCFALSKKEQSFKEDILKEIQKEAIGAFYFIERQ